MKREEPSQLLRDKVLDGANGGHLNSDGVHVLTQGNPVLLTLIPIGIKPGGKRMNLVAKGLSRTGGDLIRVAILRVACTRCGSRSILIGLLIRVARALELRLVQRYR